MKSSVLVYRSELLPSSETFIASQAGAMREFAPVFVGTRRLEHGLTLPGPVITPRLRPAAAGRLLYRHTGYAPGLASRAFAHNPKLIHAHFALDAAEALPLAHALRLPLVVTLHGYDVMCSDESHMSDRGGRLYLRYRAQLLDRTAVFLCVSKAIRDHAAARGFPVSKLQVLPIGIDTALLAPTPEPNQSRVVLFVGRLVEKKGVHVLVRAMHRVQSYVPDARLIVVGDGTERTRLEALAAQCTRGTQFLGALASSRVRELMREARCLAVPSITAANGDSEGLPTVIAEALALGVPVASTMHSGIPEIIEHGREGLLSPENDAEALAGNLLNLLNNETLVDRLRVAGRSRVLDAFDLHHQTALLESLYRRVIAEQQMSQSIVPKIAAAEERTLEDRCAAGKPERGIGQAFTTYDERENPGDRGAPEATHTESNAIAPEVASVSNTQDAGRAGTRTCEPNISELQAENSATRAGQRLRSQTAWLLSGNGLATLCQAFYFLLMGRMLGAREYGAFAGAVALVGIGSQFSSIGMEMVLLRSIARDRGCFPLVWGRALACSGAGALVLLGTLLTYGHFFLSPALRHLVPYLVCSDALMGKVTQLASRAFQGADRVQHSAKLLALNNAVRAVAASSLFLFCLGAHHRVSALVWARVYLIASSVVAALAFTMVTRIMGRPRWSALRLAHLSEGLSFSFSSSSISIYNDIDKTLLASYGLLGQAGIYAAAYRVVDVASTPIYSLFAAASPRVFRRGDVEGPEGAYRESSSLLRWAAPFGLLLAPLLIMVAPLLPRLFGHSFQDSVAVLRFLCILPLLRALHYAWGTAITACTSQWLRTGAQASVALLNLGLNLCWIPQWGWRGAAAASLASDGTLALVSLLLLTLVRSRNVNKRTTCCLET